MTLGARDHVKDQAPRGLMNHTGTDGSMAWDRVSRYGDWKSKISENMTFGPATPHDVVAALLDRRRHLPIEGIARTSSIRTSRWSESPAARTRRYRVMCDMVQAGGFVERQAEHRSSSRFE